MMDTLVLPFWAEVLVSFLLVVGSSFTLVGTIGLWRFRNFYQRMHGPTMGTSVGCGAILFASIFYFSIGEGRVVIHEMLIWAFILVTVPVTTMMLARAALYRHRREGKNVPTRHLPQDQDANEIRPTSGQDD